MEIKNTLTVALASLLFLSIFSVGVLAQPWLLYDGNDGNYNVTSNDNFYGFPTRREAGNYSGGVTPYIGEDPDQDSSLSDFYIGNESGFTTFIDGVKNQTKVGDFSEHPGLVSYWPLDNANGWDPIGGNNGTLYGGINTSAVGKVSGAYDFDGTDDRIHLPVGILTDSDDLTISFWFNSDVGNWMMDMRGDIALGITGGGDTVSIWQGSSYVIMASGLNTNQWYHLVYTWDDSASSGIMYINGSQTGTQSNNHESAGESRNTIADDSVGASHPFDGTIDEVRIYDRALSSAEISTLYNAEKPTVGNDPTLGAEETAVTNVAPKVNIESETPTDPATYTPGQTYKFNATISDPDGDDINVTQFKWNGGSYQEVTSCTWTNVSYGECEYTLPHDLSAGNYTYTWWANDTNGASNTNQSDYEVIKANTTMHVAINGTEADQTFTYPATTNTSAWTNDTGQTGVSLSRNGSSVSNPEIIELAARSYNYTATLSHENYTASSVEQMLTIDKGDSQLSLTSSNSWSMSEGGETTIDASADSALSLTVWKDDIEVSVPYTFSPDFGLYEFTVNISDKENYTPVTESKILDVLSGGFGCSDNETFAFEKTVDTTGDMLNLNFSEVLDSNRARDNLMDVWVNTSQEVWKNESEKSVVVNVTGLDNVTAYFGNYIANVSKASHSLAANTTPIDNYGETGNNYYTLNLINEMTGEPSVPPGANTSMSLVCSGGSSKFEVTDTKLLVSSFEQLQEIKALVTYSATDIYYRNILIDSPIAHRNMYLVDANKNQVVEMLFELNDQTGEYDNAHINIKKSLEGSLRNIHQQNFDAENKALGYLINGEKYQLYINSGTGSVRNIGDLYVDTTDLTKTIFIGDVITKNITEQNLTYSLYMEGNDTIVFNYVDPYNQTLSAEFWVWNYTRENDTDQQLYYANTTNASKVSFNYIVPDPNRTYKAKAEVHHVKFGKNSMTVTQFFQGVWEKGIKSLPISDKTMMGIAIMVIVAIPMIFGAVFAGMGAIIAVLFAALFFFWGWFDPGTAGISSAIIIALAGFLAVLNKIQERREGYR